MTRLVCLQNPRLKELETTVLACEPRADYWEVVLESTILYPEGGGQPADHGRVGEARVFDVQKASTGIVLHHCEQPIPEGPCRVVLDWKRRFDHMQQHTGQHLLTAVANEHFKWKTTAFHLGKQFSHIEVDQKTVSSQDIQALEDLVNQRIRAAHQILVRTIDREELENNSLRTRDLPEHITGPIRVVEIEGIDANTCGGTHVSSTTELGTIKLFPTESIRGGTRIPFVVGERVVRLLNGEWERSTVLNQLLSTQRGNQVSAVERLLKENKQFAKQIKKLQQQCMDMMATEIARRADPVIHMHFDNEAQGPLPLFARAILLKNPEARIFLTQGQTDGTFYVAGPPQWLKGIAPVVLSTLDARGGGKPGILQGKAARLQNRGALLDALQETCSP